ncbi:hypothetical protein [Nocardioides marmotae]|uniref:hypothetical protein n=1 Tax=Nocardioides marmotae TaxID=2663857 RepID=UPI0012B5CB87|nr:hypothetical protein [Nocardioides marmotae]MBC9733128.1 hypothetical protein [Nocardioides marmotae]MTB84241.1 hypothetical protein [Nocardioides marmotae]
MTAFLIIGLVGAFLLLLSLVLGDVLDGALDALAGDAFSTAVIGAFVAATGFGGAAAQALGAPAALSLPVGLAAGALFAWIAGSLTRLVRGGGTDATPTGEDALGRDGRVVTTIPDGGFGVVDVLVGGHVLRFNARADRPLDQGVRVHVTSVLSPTAVTVAPLWDELT